MKTEDIPITRACPTEDLPITSKCLSAISYFSSIAGPYSTHMPIKMGRGENPCGSWTWYADENCLNNHSRPGDWLDLMLEVDGTLSVTIYQSYAPESLFYQVLGYTLYHDHKLELD